MTSCSHAPAALPPRLRDRALFRPRDNATFGNPEFGAACARVLILRLSPWRDVASSSPHLFLAQGVRRALPDAFIDFAFLPTPEDRRTLRAAGLPFALGVQSRRSLAAFDLVLVSNSFTLETINLPFLLVDAGLAPWADERSPAAPPVILGGSNALAAHCLVRPDGVSVADAFFFGEAEECLEPFLRAWQGAVGASTKRERLLQAAAAVDGFWITGSWPDREHPVRQAVARTVAMDARARGPGRAGAAVAQVRAGLDAAAPRAAICYPLLDSESADTVRLQAAFGCPAFCSFCFEGFERKPYREIAAEELLAQARQLKAASGARCVELDAYTLNSHAESARLIAGLSRLFERVSFKSQRVDILAAQPELAALELAAGKRSFTLGIEGISTRLRAFLNKSITDDEIDRVLQDLLARAVREIKLFYLITGHETAADIAAFGTFVRQLGLRVSGGRLTTRVVFSFGYLVRMPNTPLRHDRLFLDRGSMERIAQEVERMCTRSDFEFRLASSWSDHVVAQILAAGDCRLAPGVVALAREGICHDGESSVNYARRLQEVLAADGLLDEAFAAEKSATHRFPFDFVATAVTRKFLWQQYEAGCANREAGYCLGETCRTCGACQDKAERQALTARARTPKIPDAAVAEVDALVRGKQRLAPLFCRVRLGAAFAQASAAWTSARLMQLLLASLPEEADNLLSAEEALFTAPDNRERFPIAAGETVVAVKAWDVRRLEARWRGVLAGAGAPAASTSLPPAPPPPHAVDIEVLGILPGFSAGRFVAATWQVAMEASVAGVEAAVVAWLKDAYLPFSLRRVPSGACFELTPAARRKGIVQSIGCRSEGGGSLLELTFAPKADLFSLLRQLPARRDDCGLLCTHIDWPSAGHVLAT